MNAARILLPLLCLATLPGCSGPGDDQPELIVFAAASTADVLGELDEAWPGIHLRGVFGPSSGLVRQIEDGAPADVCISASSRWIAYLEERRFVIGSPRSFCGNGLVCAAASTSPLAVSPPRDAGVLITRLPPGARVAIADRGVPAGDYARRALTASGDLDGLKRHLVGQVDVRAVLRAVAGGDVAAGFVYATDARAADVTVLFACSVPGQDPVRYVAAVPRTAGSPALAASFVEWLRSPEARLVLERAGFEVP